MAANNEAADSDDEFLDAVADHAGAAPPAAARQPRVSAIDPTAAAIAAAAGAGASGSVPMQQVTDDANRDREDAKEVAARQLSEERARSTALGGVPGTGRRSMRGDTPRGHGRGFL